MTDAELIAAVREGNLLAFKELVQRYENRIAAIIYGMLGDTPEVDDIGQDVFINFYKSITIFRGDSRLLTYLTRIAINLSYNEIRRRKRKAFISIEHGIENYYDEFVEGNDDNDKIDEEKLVHMAVCKLDIKYRSVIVMRVLEGYSIEQTAEILDLSSGTVSSRLARGLNKLKIILKPYMKETV